MEDRKVETSVTITSKDTLQNILVATHLVFKTHMLLCTFSFFYFYLFYVILYFEKDVTVTLKCQQLWQLLFFWFFSVLFFAFFLDFLQLVQGCDQYSGRQSLMPCQHLRSWASSSSVPLSISEAEYMADCPLSVTSGTV